MKARNVVIVDGVRSAFTKGGRGRLEATRMDEAGARLLLTVAKELRRSGKKYGMAIQCIGGGQGATTILEALD